MQTKSSTKINKLKDLEFSKRQEFHFDKQRADIYENVYDYRSSTFSWTAEIIQGLIKDANSALDVCTGTGDLVRAVEINGDWTGIDISLPMLEVAKKNSNGKGRFVYGDSYSMPFKSATFDAVTYKLALHHLEHPLRSLVEASRVLKKGGTIIIADVASFDNEGLHKIFSRLNTMREPANYEYRSINTVKNLLIGAGFSEFKVSKKDFDLILEDWLHNFYEPEKTIPLVLNSSNHFKTAIKLKRLGDKHKITLTSFVISAKKYA